MRALPVVAILSMMFSMNLCSLLIHTMFAHKKGSPSARGDDVDATLHHSVVTLWWWWWFWFKMPSPHTPVTFKTHVVYRLTLVGVLTRANALPPPNDVPQIRNSLPPFAWRNVVETHAANYNRPLLVYFAIYAWCA